MPPGNRDIGPCAGLQKTKAQHLTRLDLKGCPARLFFAIDEYGHIGTSDGNQCISFKGQAPAP